MMSAGLVFTLDAAGRPTYSGTCACYRARHLLVTAAHCVPEDAAAYAVLLPSDPGEGRTLRPVVSVTRSETSDIALLQTPPRDTEDFPGQVFRSVPNELVEGGDFIAFGYPVEGAGGQPTGRLFKGHHQRYFGYDDSAGRSYFAAEMSIPAPAGLSGGPIVPAHQTDQLLGVVTTNVESYVVLDSFEEVEEGGRTLRVESRRVVNYGIAALLSGHRDWLDGWATGLIGG